MKVRRPRGPAPSTDDAFSPCDCSDSDAETIVVESSLAGSSTCEGIRAWRLVDAGAEPVFAFCFGNQVGEELTTGGVNTAHNTGGSVYTNSVSGIHWKAHLDGQYGSGRGVLSLPSLSKSLTMKRSGGCWRGARLCMNKFRSAHRDTSVSLHGFLRRCPVYRQRNADLDGLDVECLSLPNRSRI